MLAISSNAFALPAPRITSFFPTSGLAGTTVTITGSKFAATAAGNTVYFPPGNIPAPVQSVNATATALTVKVPAGAITGQIKVKTAGGTAISSAAFSVLTLDSAEYVFAYPDPNGLNSAPDPTVWAVAGGSGMNVMPLPGLGLGMSDPGNSAYLLYSHATPFLSGDPSNSNFQNMATFRVRAEVPYVLDGSQAWSADALGWRIILDDGAHRLELALCRSPTFIRQVCIRDSSANPIPFPWDNGFANTYEISRMPNGDFVITLTNADPSNPTPIFTRTILAAQVPSSRGTPLFAWGSGPEGGG
ncbi:MAG TPA: IPT/TIG domain-containing protein, partial [Steroidobacter sp.]|nr:IPT/TIG domain-containing protein [Steroidobacter sp.]